MKNNFTTSGFILLMMLSTYGTNAGSLDSTRKDTCCTRTESKSAPATNDSPVAVPDATMIATSLQDKVAMADAEMTFAYMANRSFDKDALAKTDALTNLEMEVAILEPGLTKMTAVSVQEADQYIASAHKKAVSTDVSAFHPENVSKMLIDSDKDIRQHYAQQYGMVVASAK